MTPYPTLPRKYKINEDGIHLGKMLISATPYWVSEIMQEEGGRNHLVVSWETRTPSGTRVRTHVFPNTVATTPAGLQKLADVGIDVSNKGGSFKYLQAWTHLRSVPMSHAAVQMGWQDEGGFVWGKVSVGDGATVGLAPTMLPTLADAPRSHGNMGGWLTLAPILAKYPRARIGIYAALSAPLLRILGGESFALQFSGPPATGKSTCVALAASTWGCPSTSNAAPFVFPWAGSEKFLVEAAAALRDLPICLDDYDRGRAKGRAARIAILLDGVEPESKRPSPRRWNTVVICSGAKSIEELDESEGLASRTLSLWGPPFGKSDVESAEDIATIQSTLSNHYGQLGPEFLARLLRKRSHWTGWRESNEERMVLFAGEAAKMGGVASRCSKAIAFIATTAYIFHSLFPEVRWDMSASLDDLWTWLNLNGARSGKANAARIAVQDWYADNKRRIIGSPESKRGFPPGGWKGVIRHDRDGEVWIIQHVVQEILLQAGFIPGEIYRDWVMSEICIHTWGRVWRQQPIGGGAIRCIGFKKNVIEIEEEGLVQALNVG